MAVFGEGNTGTGQFTFLKRFGLRFEECNHLDSHLAQPLD